MANLAAKKSDCLTKLVSLTSTAMLVASQIQELVSYATDNGFLAAGASPIANGDCVGENAHLDAALFNAAVAAITTMTLSNQNKTTLRKVSKTPVPGA